MKIAHVICCLSETSHFYFRSQLDSRTQTPPAKNRHPQPGGHSGQCLRDGPTGPHPPKARCLQPGNSSCFSLLGDRRLLNSSNHSDTYRGLRTCAPEPVTWHARPLTHSCATRWPVLRPVLRPRPRAALWPTQHQGQRHAEGPRPWPPLPRALGRRGTRRCQRTVMTAGKGHPR